MRWRDRLLGEHSTRFALLFAFMLALPFCASGLFLDDYMHLYLLEGGTRALGDRWHLFTFARGGPERMAEFLADGPYPWWTSLDLHFSFFRPLTALVANLEHAVVGRYAPLQHLHSILWYLGVIVATRLLYRRAFGAAISTAALATLLFAIDDAHSLVAGWVANRNATLASVPAVLGVVAHVRWREDGWRWGLPLSLLGAATGLAAGEVALGALAYLGAYELVRGPGNALKRITSLVPMGLLGLAYVAVYKLTDSGARHSGVYADPLAETGKYLTQAPAKLLTLAGAQFLNSTADLWLAMEAARPVLVALGVLALMMVGGLLKATWAGLSDDERGAVRWLGLGSALSALPVLATFPLNRMLLMPSVGGAAVTAVLLHHGWASAVRWVRWSTRAMSVATVGLGVLGWFATFAGAAIGGHVMRTAALEARVSDDALAGRVFTFLAPDPSAAMYPAVLRHLEGKRPARTWLTMSFAPYAHRLTRLDERTMEVEIVDGQLVGTLFEQLFRGDEAPVTEGLRVRLTGVEVVVTRASAGRVQALQTRFDEPLESGFFTFVQWKGDVLEPLVVPAVGQSLTLPKPNGMLSL